MTASANNSARHSHQVKLDASWLAAWLPKLSHSALKLFLELAVKPTRIPKEQLEGLDLRAREELAAVNLVELVAEDPVFVHFTQRRDDGSFGASPVLPSLAEALNFQRRMHDELLESSTQDDSPALRAKIFERYPELGEEFRVYEQTREADSPRWRLWLELSRFFINQFEREFGALKPRYGELFKETAAQVLRHKLEVIDAITLELFEDRIKIFPETGKNWIVSLPEAEFVSHPRVRALAERYAIGPAQILVNTLEYFGQQGFVVAELDGAARLADIYLPSTTGLTKSEERILFLRPEERAQGLDNMRNQERVRRAAAKYANNLMRRGCEVLLHFVHLDRVTALEELLETIASRVNENLELVPNPVDDFYVEVDHVLEKYNELREEYARSR